MSGCRNLRLGIWIWLWHGYWTFICCWTEHLLKAGKIDTEWQNARTLTLFRSSLLCNSSQSGQCDVGWSLQCRWGKRGHLFSINSDVEWRFITTHHMRVNSMSTLLQLLHASMYFTGLRGQVSSVGQNKRPSGLEDLLELQTQYTIMFWKVLDRLWYLRY